MKTKTSENIGTVLGFAVVIALVAGFYLTPAGSIIVSSLPMIVIISAIIVTAIATVLCLIDTYRNEDNSGASEMLEFFAVIGTGFISLGIIADKLSERK